MKLEFINYKPQEEQPKTKESSPKRLMLAMELWKKAALNKMEIKGQENLKNIPKDQKIIIATTHLSDLDVPAAFCALGKDLDIAITNESVHHSFREEPDTNISMRLAGKDNFIPIDYKKKDDRKSPKLFNPENFEPMLEAIGNGKRILISAQTPLQKGETKIPDSGYGAAYLAEISDALILPVAVRLLSNQDKAMYEDRFKTLLKKSDAEVIVGEPFKLEKIEGIERMKLLLEKRKNEGSLNKEEREEFSKLASELKEKSRQLLDKVLELLPK